MQTTITPKFVQYIPEELEQGILYISLEYDAALHKCCCGCGNTVSTPIDPNPPHNGWTLTNDSGRVSLSPSIGNFQLPCKTHYFIRENQVVWC